MTPRRKLTRDQIAAIKGLRGVMAIDRIKKLYGIGAKRLYRIWEEPSPDEEICARLERLEALVEQTNEMIKNLLAKAEEDGRFQRELWGISNLEDASIMNIQDGQQEAFSNILQPQGLLEGASGCQETGFCSKNF